MRSDTFAIADALGRAQRRMMLVECWRSLAFAFPLTLVAAEAVILFTQGLTKLRRPYLAALATMLVPLAAAAIRAIVRRPTLRDAAAAVDTRLGFDQRLITAVQFLGDDDPFAQLVERDAASRLSGFDPARALPLHMPRAAYAGIVLALLLPAAVVLTTALRSGDWTRSMTALAGDTVLEIPSPSAAGADMRSATTARPAHSQAVSSGERRGVELTPQPSQRALGESPAMRTPASSDTREGDSSGSGTGRARSTSASPHAGGVAAGDLASRLADTAADTDAGSGNTPEYRAAWSHAQASIAQDRVPLDRRALVKRYFEAIRPQESR